MFCCKNFTTTSTSMFCCRFYLYFPVPVTSRSRLPVPGYRRLRAVRCYCGGDRQYRLAVLAKFKTMLFRLRRDQLQGCRAMLSADGISACPASHLNNAAASHKIMYKTHICIIGNFGHVSCRHNAHRKTPQKHQKTNINIKLNYLATCCGKCSLCSQECIWQRTVPIISPVIRHTIIVQILSAGQESGPATDAVQ